MTSTSSRFADYERRRTAPSGTSTSTAATSRSTCAIPSRKPRRAGVSSSVNDMTHWLAMVLANGSHEGQQIVDPKPCCPPSRPNRVEPRDRARDAVRVLRLRIQRVVDIGGRAWSSATPERSTTNFVILPSADVAVVALTNATPSGVPEALTAEFADLVQFGEVREDWYQLYNSALVKMEQPVGALVGKQRPANPSPAPLSSYVGTYANDYGARDQRAGR